MPLPRLPHWSSVIGWATLALIVLWLLSGLLMVYALTIGRRGGEYMSYPFVLGLLGLTGIPIALGLVVVGSTLIALIVELVIPGKPPTTAHQCSKCSYDLTGNTSGRCPECASPVCDGSIREVA